MLFVGKLQKLLKLW